MTLFLTISRRGVSFLLVLRRKVFVADKPSDLVQGTLDMLIPSGLPLRILPGEHSYVTTFLETSGRARAVNTRFFNDTAGESGCERWDSNSHPPP
jgi:hypothetical protein